MWMNFLLYKKNACNFTSHVKRDLVKPEACALFDTQHKKMTSLKKLFMVLI